MRVLRVLYLFFILCGNNQLFNFLHFCFQQAQYITFALAATNIFIIDSTSMLFDLRLVFVLVTPLSRLAWSLRFASNFQPVLVPEA